MCVEQFGGANAIVSDDSTNAGQRELQTLRGWPAREKQSGLREARRRRFGCKHDLLHRSAGRMRRQIEFKQLQKSSAVLHRHRKLDAALMHSLARSLLFCRLIFVPGHFQSEAKFVDRQCPRRESRANLREHAIQDERQRLQQFNGVFQFNGFFEFD